MTTSTTGAFVAVVGPSGVGKDSVMAEVRRRLGDDPRFVFARRVITRVPDGTEDHDTIDEASFDAAERAGAFSLSWRAHGLGYGIPARYADDVAAGRVVVANLSRAVLDDARRRFPRTLVLCITAPAAIVARRLAARGRESASEIAERLARAEAVPASGPGIVTVDNGGALDSAAALAVSHLNALLEPAQ
ncbi:phosphonate metabolism protein/1,5-bisphosphokinase (PRPP-forming) PhnN [Chthonobacter albigriseus]|uniref:phosphonate metabolism protein/1,5-bisphosphokinase (PRPP-forming) PhnN n=1 Tax=Chthonobacter albigriseus TaxID=1683161 RepID=UPI0015EFBDB7|nr:phosphonate metabolism protein/1,5-bisphosphokinase (PRPP-forming) PhnN [Chthonobacter albigriseus]